MLTQLLLVMTTLAVHRASNLWMVELPGNLASLFGVGCISGTEHEFSIFTDLYRHATIAEKQNVHLLQTFDGKMRSTNENCLPLFLQKPKHKNLDKWYQYGNWCGYDYGGFDNDCRDDCRGIIKYNIFTENIWQPSANCLKCNPPTDYVDTQCMYHDFCMERFQRYHILEGSACNSSNTTGQQFLSPCACPINLTYHLTPAKLQVNCLDFNCRFNGQLIYEVFTDPQMTCTCTSQTCPPSKPKKHLKISRHHDTECQETQECTTVTQCETLHTQEGDPDEGII